METLIILKEIFFETIRGGWTQIYAAFCCFVTSWIVLKRLQIRKKILSRDYLLFFLWFFGFLWWYLNYLALRSAESSVLVAAIFFKSALIFLVLHLYFFLPLLLRYLVFNKKAHLFFDVIFGSLWFSFMFYSLATSYVIYNPLSENKLLLISSVLSGKIFFFFLGGLDFVFLFLAFFTIFLNIHRRIFFLKDLSNFYLFSAVVLYSGASILNLFFIYTRNLPYIFFTLVPILTYMGYKKYFKKPETV